MSISTKFLEHILTYDLDPECMMDGPEDAEIVIINEFPSSQDAKMGKPFLGGAGKIVWNTLRNFGILKPHCYVTNAVKRQVTKNYPVQHTEYTLWQEALQYEISQLKNAKVIICFGNTPMEMLTSLSGITQRRGSVYEYNGIPVVIANTPSMAMRKPETEIIFQMDMEKAKRVLDGDYNPPVIHKKINPTFEEAMLYMDSIQDTHKKFAIDIEVISGETACIGLAHSANYAMCINFRDATSNRYTVAQEFKLLQRFVKLCDDPSTFVIAQNGNFDAYFMGYKDHAVFKLDFDTLLAHHTMYPRLPHNLGFLTAQYTDHAYYKDDKDIFKEGGDIEAFWEYNCTDCAITFAVAEKEMQELKDQNLDEFFFNHVMRLQPHLSYTTTAGVKVDLERKAQLNEELSETVNKLREEFVAAARSATKNPNLDINPNSPKQLADLFFNQLRFNVRTKSTNADVREKIMKDPRTSIESKDMLAKLNNYAEENKFYSTYVKTNIDDDGRFRAEFKQYGVAKAPGRLSSGKTLWGSGGNAQNQPHRAYEMYMPDDDCVMIYFDLSQAEARYVAWDAWIEPWMEDFERARIDGSYDAHRALASTMFKVPYDDVPKNDHDENGNFTMRFIAKRCRHGLNYRMHIARLAQTTGMHYGQAAQNYYLYHRTTPELQQWWKDVEREVRRTRQLFNAFGRRFIVMERLEDSDIMDSIIAFKPQSSIGDKTQRVWYQCHEDDRWDMQKARIALNVHDALIGIARPEYAKTALSIMKAYAEEPILVPRTKDKKVHPMIIPADTKISVAGEDGKHRLSTLKGIDIEAASL